MDSVQLVALPTTTRPHVVKREVESVRHLRDRLYEVTVKETVKTTNEFEATAGGPAGISLAFIRMALRKNRSLREGGRLRMEVTPLGGDSTLLQEVRYRDERTSVVLHCGSHHRPSMSGRSALLAALASREAVIEGHSRQVDAFSTTWLGIPAHRAAWWRDAVGWALLADWTDALGHHAAEESVLALLKRDMHTAHAQLKPLWERKTGGQRVALLSDPVGDSLVLGDLLTDPRSPESAVLGTEFTDRRVPAVLRQLQAPEEAVARDWATTGESWAQAALAAERPAAYGERVRRKLKRHGQEFAARRATQP
ncbi:hypothetical protein [Streptomyces rochei]|uniref:hypothetical protein n=1 Tax=Streptomyces rochei TaxID=1928 RepID=UPI0037BA71D4